jgi:hypothetical protein
MDALAQRIPIQPVALGIVTDHDEFPVEHDRPVDVLGDRGHDLREVAVERFPGARLQQHRVVVAARVDEHQAAETVPLRFEEQALTPGDLRDGARQHRCDRWVHG